MVVMLDMPDTRDWYALVHTNRFHIYDTSLMQHLTGNCYGGRWLYRRVRVRASADLCEHRGCWTLEVGESCPLSLCRQVTACLSQTLPSDSLALLFLRPRQPVPSLTVISGKHAAITHCQYRHDPSSERQFVKKVNHDPFRFSLRTLLQ